MPLTARNASETGSKLAIMIADEILRRLAIRSRLPQLLSGSSVGRSARHTDVDDFPRFQVNDEKRKERPKEEIGDLEKIAGPPISSVIMEDMRACVCRKALFGTHTLSFQKTHVSS